MNDIAILRLEKELQLTQGIQLACLPPSSPAYPTGENIDAYAVGWGKNATNSTSPVYDLNNVKLKIYDASKCKPVNEDMLKDWNSQICAGRIYSISKFNK